MPHKIEGDFWITMQGNCLDVAVLEWCKLFGEHNGKHCWKKIVDDQGSFQEELITTIGITKDIWEDCRLELRAYRDAFVAHLDSGETMHIPMMNLPRDMVRFYFNYIQRYEDGVRIFNKIINDLDDYYEMTYRDAAFRATRNHSQIRTS